MIQLYCTVNSSNVTFSWTKDSASVVIDVPHLRERTCNTSTTTTSVLTIDNFQSSDDGTYQCTAMDGVTRVNGDTVTLTGIMGGESASYIVLWFKRKLCSDVNNG